jgi:uncharacterized protein (DUF4213/DUF364 family)
MKILDHVMSTLDFNTAVETVCQGVFHTAVVTRHCGLAATLPRDALHQKPPMVRDPGALTEYSPERLARLAYSERILEAAIGMAAVNSLLEIDENACSEINAADVIMKKAAGKRAAIVGHFPFIPKVRDIADTLWVMEKNPQQGDLTEDQADHRIPQADVVAITGTALTNHTMDHLLSLCAPEAFVVLLGDTAPLSPVFFEYGVDAVSGTRVSDPGMALKCVAQGANFRQIRGTRRLTLFKDKG